MGCCRSFTRNIQTSGVEAGPLWVTVTGTSVSQGSLKGCPSKWVDATANGEALLWISVLDARSPSGGRPQEVRTVPVSSQGELSQLYIPGGSHKRGRVCGTETVMFIPYSLFLKGVVCCLWKLPGKNLKEFSNYKSVWKWRETISTEFRVCLWRESYE